MFVRQTPQQFRNSSADVQIFYGNGSANNWWIWNKPPGVSHIYILSIGAGGNGDGATPGGSGGTYVWYGAARNVPDSLQLLMGVGGTSGTNIYYRYPESVVSFMSPGTPSFAGPTGPGNSTPFSSSGIRYGRGGQAGGSTGASIETFLSAGGTSTQTGNYGYTSSLSNSNGYFLLQPIIAAVGALGNNQRVAAYGCGGGTAGTGGPGMILIASW